MAGARKSPVICQEMVVAAIIDPFLDSLFPQGFQMVMSSSSISF